MAEIIFRLPSKATQYGYVEVRDTVDTEVTPEELAKKYADWVKRFQTTEMAAKPKKPDSRLIGDILSSIPDEADEDVIGAASSKLTELLSEAGPATGPTDADDGNGHALSSEEIKEMVRTELGGSVVSDAPAPWDGKGKVPANLQPKPWQKGARKAPVADLFS